MLIESDLDQGSGGWFRFPRWVRRRITNDKARALYELLADLVNNTTRTWRGTQSYLAYVLKVSIRTIQRWLHHLREVGVLQTRPWIDSRGYHSTNIHYLPLNESDISNPPRSGGSVTKTRITSSSLTSFERVPSGSLRSPDGREQGKLNDDGVPMKISSDQLSLFADETGTDPFDSLGSSCHTGSSKIKEKVVTEECGSPTNRVMRYWLRGRDKRPKPGVIAGVGRAVRTCLDSGVHEEEIKRAFDALMTVGLDAYPNQLLARFGLRKRPKNHKPRDYEKRPLWQQQPRASTMTSERKIATTPPQFRPGWTTPSPVETSTPSSVPSPTAGPRSTMTGTPEPVTVHVDVKISKERYGRDEWVYEHGTMVHHRRGGRQLKDIVAAMGLVSRRGN